MTFMRPKIIALSLAATIAAVLLLSAGFYLGKAQQEKLLAERLVADAWHTVGALLYLERDEHESAREFLIMAVESHVIDLSLLESVELDDATKAVRGQALERFAAMRRKWPSSKPEEFRHVDDMVDAYIARHNTRSGSTPGVTPSR